MLLMILVAVVAKPFAQSTILSRKRELVPRFPHEQNAIAAETAINCDDGCTKRSMACLEY